MSPLLKTIVLLLLSNTFMTFAWYYHLKKAHIWPVMTAVLVSWGIAFFEYLLQVPANRISYANDISVSKLKIIQEVITLSVFVPFAILVLKEHIGWNYLWASLCMLGAVFFIFRG